MRKSKGDEAIQLKGVIIATAIGFIGGGLTFLPAYEITFPQYGIFVMPIYPFVIAYFMIRHRLFDLEQAIQAFQREKLVTIGLIASSINHEIRNPLYAARGILENFKEGVGRKPVEEITDKTLKQINRALDVITKLNRFAKPAGEVPASNAQASIPEAIQTVLDLVSYEFELDKIHIQNEISKDVPLVQADQRQLEEILFNLIVNACHAIKQKGGGNLVISTSCHPEPFGACHSERSAHFRRRTSSSSRKVLAQKARSEESTRLKGKLREGSRDSSGYALRMTGKIQIIISDTGTGISAEQAKHLFEPFYTTKGEKGTGLGLYVTKQLVERNGGKIKTSSKPGQGSVFTVSLRR